MTPRQYSMERRTAAVEETRRRIVDAALALHAEKGILTTNWEDIARRADVSPATVYRHFSSLDHIVTACGQQVHAVSRPPDADTAKQLFVGAERLAERVDRLVRELHGFYERGAPNIEAARREQHLLPQLAADVARQHAVREALVREALRAEEPTEQTISVASALTDFPVWKALSDRGLEPDVVTETVRELLFCSLSKTREAKERPTTGPGKARRKG
jgi:AcrR family transcriptional regulator